MTATKLVETQGVEYGAIRTELDQEAVERYLVANMPGFKLGSIHQFSFGQSNPTYLINSASDPPQQYVLRKKPPGKLVSQTAHAIEREYKIIKAIGEDGTVPVPKVYALCLDASILGTPFYVMEYIKVGFTSFGYVLDVQHPHAPMPYSLQGRIFTDVRMPEIETKEERTKCWMSIIKTLASLHKLNPDKIGLGDFGSKAPFYPRQIKSLSRVSKAQALVKDDATGNEVGEIPGFDFLVDWYSKNAPEGRGLEGGVIHGDFKCDNMIFHPTKPEVIGVLDWELSTLGHPYSDLANLLQPFYVPEQEGAPRPSALSALRDISQADLPIPSAEQLLKAYCKEMGQPYPLQRWTAAVSFAFFRLAVITQGIAARAAKGQASSAKAKSYSTMFPLVGMLAVDTIERAGQTGGDSKL